MNIRNVCPSVRFSSLFWCLLVMVVGLSFTGCGGGSGPIGGDGTSGVRGVVTTTFGTPNNTPVPVANALVSIEGPPAQHQAGVGAPPTPGPVLLQGQTDAQGRYSIPIRPGSYVVVATQDVTTGTGALGISRVTVPARQFVEADVPFTTAPSP